MQKNLREMEGELNDVKDDLDSERKDRQRADKQRKDLSEELEALKTELEETTETGAVQQQVRMPPSLRERLAAVYSIWFNTFHWPPINYMPRIKHIKPLKFIPLIHVTCVDFDLNMLPCIEHTLKTFSCVDHPSVCRYIMLC